MSKLAESQRATISNEEQLWLMQQVKDKIMTIDEAVSWTESRENELRSMEDDVIPIKEKPPVLQKKPGFKATRKFKNLISRKQTKHSSEQPNKRKLSQNSSETTSDILTLNDLKNKQIYNFSVYRFGKHKTPQKRIFQIDFDLRYFSIIHHGNIEKSSPFSSLGAVNGKEGKKLFISLDDRQELEIDAENLADKTKLMRLLNIISDENDHEDKGHEFNPCDILQQSFRIIKEGLLEKQGGYSAGQWNKRLVVIRCGELAYYRVEEEELTAALNIIHLSPGSVDINTEDNRTFIISTTHDSHRFRIPERVSYPLAIQDEWIQAIKQGCFRQYQEAEQFYETPSPSHSNADPFERFRTIYQELEKLKVEVTGNENKKLQSQIEDFVSLLKDIESTQLKSDENFNNLKLSSIQEKQNSRTNSKASMYSSTTAASQGSLKTDQKRFPTSINCDYSELHASEQLENIYDVPDLKTQQLNSKKKHKNKKNGKKSILNDADDSSDEDRITTFDCLLPPPPSPVIKTNSAKSSVTDETDILSLPLPPPSMFVEETPLSNQALSNGVAQPLPNGILSYASEPGVNENDVYSEIPTQIESNIQSEANVIYDDIDLKRQISMDVLSIPSPISTTSSVSNLASSTECLPVIANERPVSPNSHNNQAGTIPVPPPDSAIKVPSTVPVLPDEAPLPPPLHSPGVQPLPSVLPSGVSQPLSFSSSAIPPPPPPPALSAPPPPPPPVFPDGVPPPPGLSLTNTDNNKNKLTLRPFHWVPVPKQLINKSMWKSVPDLSSFINVDEIKESFLVTDKKVDSDNTPKRGSPGDFHAKRKHYESYLDQKTAQNLGIFLAGFKLRGEELMLKLSIVKEENGGVSTEHVVGLLKYAPEPELKSLYQKHAGKENEELAKEDRFVAELSRIPRLGLRLETLLIVREVPNEIEFLEPEIDLVLNACHELLTSKQFESLLYYVLTVSNLINSSNSKGSTKGIRLSTLPKTSAMRTNDRKLTLLQVVVKMIKNSQPSVLSLCEELTSLSKSQTYSIKGLLAEIDVMRKSSFKARKNCDLLRRKKNQPTKEDLAFCSEIETELTKIDEKTKRLSDKCLEIRQAVSKVLVKFGESPDTDSQELFKWVRDFLEDFRKCIT